MNITASASINVCKYNSRAHLGFSRKYKAIFVVLVQVNLVLRRILAAMQP